MSHFIKHQFAMQKSNSSVIIKQLIRHALYISWAAENKFYFGDNLGLIFSCVFMLVFMCLFVGFWPDCLWLTGPVWGWRRNQQRRSLGTAQSVWGEARNQPSVAGGGAGAGAQGGERRKWCELLSQRMGLSVGRETNIMWTLVSENRAHEGKEENYMNSCVREWDSTRGNKKKDVNSCQRMRLSNKKKMWTLVSEIEAQQGKEEKDVNSCVREECPWFLCQTGPWVGQWD